MLLEVVEIMLFFSRLFIYSKWWGCCSIFTNLRWDASAAKPNCPRRSDVDAGAGDALCVNAPRGNGLRSGHAESRAAARR